MNYLPSFRNNTKTRLVAGFIGSSIGLLSQPTRRAAWSGLAMSLVLLLMFPLAVRACVSVRAAGFRMAAQRAEPVVRAVEQYVEDNGAPPDSRTDLVPRYLQSLPSRVPPLELVTGKDAARYGGNQWVLRASVPTGIINFDQFVYFPNQQYPRAGFGGWLQRIDAWAYVHE